MLWFILGGIYSLALMALGIIVGLKLNNGLTLKSPQEHITKPQIQVKQSQSTALKSMTPQERNLENSKEIRERIEVLLK